MRRRGARTWPSTGEPRRSRRRMASRWTATSARWRRRSTCRAPSPSPGTSAAAPHDYSRTSQPEPRRCWRRRWPSSRAAPARWSPRRAWRRSTSCCRCSARATSCSRRTTATAAPTACSPRAAERGHFDVAFVDQGDAGGARRGARAPAELVLVETPSNPLMRVVDIRAHRRRGRTPPARRSPSTTPSCRRRCSGRSRSAPTSSSTRRPSTSTAIPTWSAARSSPPTPPTPRSSRPGPTSPASPGAPFDAYLTLRGLRTLFPRIERQQANAMAVARFLAGHPAVAAVHYPGLRVPSRPCAGRAPSRTASARC